MSREKAKPPQPSKRRKPYRSPVLHVYGDVRKLTAGTGGKNADSSGGGNTRMCWIAEALYGPGSPRVLVVRGWLTQRHADGALWARLAVPMYSRFGERIAAAMGTRPALRAAFRVLFDAFIRRGAASALAAARRTRRRR